MARPLRIELSGGIYHVTSRGDGREDIFLTDQDRVAWLEVFGQTCERFNWVCHAWCQMTNHYHLLIETPEANLAQGMRQLNGVYTQRFNRNHERVGHVFQGRYKAIIVERDSYLMGCRQTGYWCNSVNGDPAQLKNTYGLSTRAHACRACGRNCRDRYTSVQNRS